MDKPLQALIYRLDDQDRIRAIDGPWNEFAAANSAPELTTERVLNQPLWRFIAGDDVQHLLRLVFDRVRATGEQLRVPFRCDSPRQRRFMSLSIFPHSAGMLHLESVLVREEPRDYMPLLERSSRLLYGTLRMCSWCKRVRLFNGQWVEVEEAAERMKLFHSPELPSLTHGICLPCAEQHLQFTVARDVPVQR